MKKMINKVHVEGRISEHSLEMKTSKKGVEYIGGKIYVATDDLGVNIVPVEFGYVAAVYGSGKENKNFGVLKNIITSGKTILNSSLEEATMVKIDSAVDVNDWYRDENGEKILVSTQRVNGGFIHIETAISKDESVRNRYECDMVITGTKLIEADEEKGTKDKLVLKGCTFDYNNKLIPIELSVINENGINYFQDLDITNNTPAFTKVWGKIVNETIVTMITEESAFGEPVVKEDRKYKRDWTVTGTATIPYEFDDESSLTAKELKDAIAARQVTLSEILQNQLQREAEKKANSNNANSFSATAPANGTFNF